MTDAKKSPQGPPDWYKLAALARRKKVAAGLSPAESAAQSVLGPWRVSLKGPGVDFSQIVAIFGRSKIDIPETRHAAPARQVAPAEPPAPAKTPIASPQPVRGRRKPKIA